jgi:hypothetical protein
MISVRIEELPAEQILLMHEYYERLKRKEVEKGAKFSLLFSPLYNFLAGTYSALLRTARAIAACAAAQLCPLQRKPFFRV